MRRHADQHHGAPVAYQFALRRPESVLGLIVQNGSAHDEGMVGIWDDARAFWADPSPENRAKLPDWLNFEGARAVYREGVPERLKGGRNNCHRAASCSKR